MSIIDAGKWLILFERWRKICGKFILTQGSDAIFHKRRVQFPNAHQKHQNLEISLQCLRIFIVGSLQKEQFNDFPDFCEISPTCHTNANTAAIICSSSLQPHQHFLTYYILRTHPAAHSFQPVAHFFAKNETRNYLQVPDAATRRNRKHFFHSLTLTCTHTACMHCYNS